MQRWAPGDRVNATYRARLTSVTQINTRQLQIASGRSPRSTWLLSGRCPRSTWLLTKGVALEPDSDEKNYLEYNLENYLELEF